MAIYGLFYQAEISYLIQLHKNLKKINFFKCTTLRQVTAPNKKEQFIVACRNHCNGWAFAMENFAD